MTHRYSCSMHGASDRFVRSAAASCLLAIALSSGVHGDPTASVPPGQPAEAAQPPAPPTEAPKSLDDLLGVPGDPSSGASAEDAARREQEKRLQKSLDEASMSDLLHRAVEGMKTASDRLTDEKDAGLGTQRIQEEVVKTLDRLLQEAQRRQSKPSPSKSQSKRSSKDDPSEKNGQQQKQQKSQRPQGSQPSRSNDSNDDAREGTRDDAVAATQELTESRIEWGRLPERVRELVLQGRRDRVSTIYERLTREYYRRLAEEASR